MGTDPLEKLCPPGRQIETSFSFPDKDPVACRQPHLPPVMAKVLSSEKSYYPWYFLKINVAFVPPKPKEFVMTTSTLCSLALCGT